MREWQNKKSWIKWLAKRKGWKNSNIGEKFRNCGKSNCSNTERLNNRNRDKWNRKDSSSYGESRLCSKKSKECSKNMLTTLQDFYILTLYRKPSRLQTTNLSAPKVPNTFQSIEHDILFRLIKEFLNFISATFVLVSKSFYFNICFYLLLALTSPLQAVNRNFSPLRFYGITLAS